MYFLLKYDLVPNPSNSLPFSIPKGSSPVYSKTSSDMANEGVSDQALRDIIVLTSSSSSSSSKDSSSSSSDTLCPTSCDHNVKQGVDNNDHEEVRGCTGRNETSPDKMSLALREAFEELEREDNERKRKWKGVANSPSKKAGTFLRPAEVQEIPVQMEESRGVYNPAGTMFRATTGASDRVHC